MIVGLGTDLCPVQRWHHLLDRFGDKAIHRILHPEEAAWILQGPETRRAERLAGRWALREAFGKALGVGLEGWSWRELRYRNGRLWVEGRLADRLAHTGIHRIHGTVTHDQGWALAFVILESDVPPPN